MIPPGYVYFIEAGEGGPVKVGYGVDPEKRLYELQQANPEELTLLAVVPGGWADERAYHRRFASGWIRGEWFRRDTPGLEEAIEAAAEADGEFLVTGVWEEAV